MKKLLLLAVLGTGGYFAYDMTTASVDDLKPAQAAEGVRHAETTLDELEAAGATFADLARPGVYTLIVVSSDRCPPCQKLEKRLPAFLSARPDVVVMTVDLPSSFSAGSEQEAQKMMASMQARNGRYNVGSTPHVEIFDPSGKPIARDDGSDKDGYELLQEWIAAEG